MSQLYALPCGCGQPIPVQQRMAGGTVRCDACGVEHDVPQLRAMRQLDQLQAESPRKSARQWGRLNGVLFSFGLFILVVAAASCYSTYRTKAAYDPFAQRPDDKEIRFQLDIQEISLVDSWKFWTKVADKRLDQRAVPQYMAYKKASERLGRYMVAQAIAGVVGLLMMLASVFVRGS